MIPSTQAMGAALQAEIDRFFAGPSYGPVITVTSHPASPTFDYRARVEETIQALIRKHGCCELAFAWACEQYGALGTDTMRECFWADVLNSMADDVNAYERKASYDTTTD